MSGPTVLTLADAQAAMPGHYGGDHTWPDDVPWPHITYQVVDHGLFEAADFRARFPGFHANPFRSHQVRSSLETHREDVPSLSETIDVWQVHRPEGPRYEGGRWQPEDWLWHAGTDGAGFSEKTREQVIRWGVAHCGLGPFFWLDKLAWARNGDLRPADRRTRREAQRVARVGGTHYVLGNDMTGRQQDRTEGRRGDLRGMGGRRVAFRFIDGTYVESDDVWFQGVIPVEFREALPDNAVMVEPERAPAVVATS